MDMTEMRDAVMSDQADIPYQGPRVHVDYDAGTDEFVVQAPPLLASRVRQVLGRRHLRKEDVWRMPATRAQAAGLSGVFHAQLHPTPAAAAHVQRLFSLPEPVSLTLSSHLFPFQRDGVALLRGAESALLGDEMGTGKTIQAIEWMRLSAQRVVGRFHLVVCPNSMKYRWADEVAAWWPGATPHVIDGTAGKRREQIEAALADEGQVVVIINYESLRTHSALAPWAGRTLTDKQKEEKELNAAVWTTVVVDEAHKIKDPGAQQTMAVKRMGQQATFRLAMTGTPILNDPDDLWSIMNFVAPDEYGSRNQFRNRYCITQSAWHGGFENIGLRPEVRPEFDSFFLPRFVRRTKTEVLPELPEKFPVEYRVLPMESKQAKAYSALVEDMMVGIGGDLLIAENPLSLMIRLRQVACALPVLDEDGNVVALDAPSNKLEAILDLLDEAPGDPLVVYAESRKFIELLAQKLDAKGYRVGMVTGAQGARVRERAVKDFQDGKLDVLLGTLGAGAEGLTLTRANRIVLAQQSWSHATNAQAIDRVHRIGQDRGVQPIVLVSEGTVDHAVAMMDLTKEARLQELVRDPDWMKAAMRGEIR